MVHAGLVVHESRTVGRFAAAMTMWPFLLLRPGLAPADREAVLVHEPVHGRQQRLFALVGAVLSAAAQCVLADPSGWIWALVVPWGLASGWAVGLAAWYACYELLLPVGWNPFRWRWELAAYRAQGIPDAMIKEALRRPPYHLWWMR